MIQNDYIFLFFQKYMLAFPKGLQKVIENFSSLPGIGEKTAIRLAFSMLKKTEFAQKEFANSLSQLSEKIHFCSECFHICDIEEEICAICSHPKRNAETMCIVETSLDILAIERSSSFFGKFFVLGGVLSPMDGIGPDEIRTDKLLKKLENISPKEIIFALPATLEGEATSLFLSQKITKIFPHISFSRLARGIPLGSEVQYADENTLSKAFEGRQKL